MAEEIETWRTVYNELKQIHDRYAATEFKKHWRELEIEAGYRLVHIKYKYISILKRLRRVLYNENI